MQQIWLRYDIGGRGYCICYGMLKKGLITKKDSDGIELKRGDSEAMLEMVKKIGNNEGFGKVLGQAVRKAAQDIGGIAVEYAIHTKGLEFPCHDPSAAMGWAIAYAT